MFLLVSVHNQGNRTYTSLYIHIDTYIHLLQDLTYTTVGASEAVTVRLLSALLIAEFDVYRADSQEERMYVKWGMGKKDQAGPHKHEPQPSKADRNPDQFCLHGDHCRAEVLPPT